ncbi:stage III sporulation protein AA, partial [Clostridium sp.]|uniref:stage III sporulation protein AA n=1 Tax=Clostridium sp. TaxID=1506 RepID=UPI0026273874
IRNISSINIRICREVIGSSEGLMKYISSKNRVYNTLIVSPPKCGKTTILRDITRNISYGVKNIGLEGKKVSVIDERSEIAACYNGIPQLDVGIRTDVLDSCFKKDGMIMAIRSLSPEVIICDEIGTEGDIEALNMAFNSGVNILVTIHGYSIEDICNRKVFKELIENSILERVVVLSNRYGVGTIEKIYSVNEKGDLNCLKDCQ